jgi:predicted nucleotidyltransferase
MRHGYDAPSDICPTRNEALQDTLVVKEYIQELNDLFARKLEAIIDIFGWQTRLVEAQSLKLTVMSVATNNFTHSI